MANLYCSAKKGYRDQLIEEGWSEEEAVFSNEKSIIIILSNVSGDIDVQANIKCQYSLSTTIQENPKYIDIEYTNFHPNQNASNYIAQIKFPKYMGTWYVSVKTSYPTTNEIKNKEISFTFKDDSRTIVFYDDDEEVGSVTGTKDDGTEWVPPFGGIPIPTKSSYEFRGYKDEGNTPVFDYENGDFTFNDSYWDNGKYWDLETSQLNVYAIWDRKSDITINYLIGGINKQVKNMPGSQIIPLSDTEGKDSYNFNLSGSTPYIDDNSYLFEGWEWQGHEEDSQWGVYYQPGDSITLQPDDFYDQVFTAKWHENTTEYPIYYKKGLVEDLKINEVENFIDESSFRYEDQKKEYITLSPNTPTRYGHKFLGWCTQKQEYFSVSAPSNEEKLYQPNEQYPIDSWTKELTFYAWWSQNKNFTIVTVRNDNLNFYKQKEIDGEDNTVSSGEWYKSLNINETVNLEEGKTVGGLSTAQGVLVFNSLGNPMINSGMFTDKGFWNYSQSKELTLYIKVTTDISDKQILFTSLSWEGNNVVVQFYLEDNSIKIENVSLKFGHSKNAQQPENFKKTEIVNSIEKFSTKIDFPNNLLSYLICEAIFTNKEGARSAPTYSYIADNRFAQVKIYDKENNTWIPCNIYYKNNQVLLIDPKKEVTKNE